jgi:hypothetical protein
MFLFVVTGYGGLGLKDPSGDREARGKRPPRCCSRRTQELGRIS